MPSRDSSFLRRFFASPLFIIVAAVLVVLVGFANIRVYYRSYKIHQEIASLEREIDRLERKKLESMEVLKYVMSNNFVEDKARTELNMQEPGEHVVVLSGLASTSMNGGASAAVLGDEASRQTIPNPIKWWYYFTHKSLAESK